MSKSEKVIFDTNKLRDNEPTLKHFLGNRSELEKFHKVTDIIIPDIVIGELKRQKIKSLESKKDSFLSNPFHWIRKIDLEETRSFDNAAHIAELESTETIKYTTITLSDYSILEKMKLLALNKLPPFESSDNTDKGFKDAYLYFTVLEYLQVIPDKYVFVCTQDGKLKEALLEHQNIIVVGTYDEFHQKSLLSLTDKYFLDKLGAVFGLVVAQDDILGYWYNIDDAQIVLVKVLDKKFVVEVDNREIITYWNTENYTPLIESLISSESYGDTHRLVKELKADIRWFSDNEIEKLFIALFENDQIRGAYGYAVKDFYVALFRKKGLTLNLDLREKMEKLLNH